MEINVNLNVRYPPDAPPPTAATETPVTTVCKTLADLFKEGRKVFDDLLDDLK